MNSKALFSISACLLFLGGMAQKSSIQSVPAAPRTSSSYEDLRSTTIQQPELQFQSRGSDFFYEDFANGLDGNTAYGAWTTEDTGITSIWMMADENSPGGEFSNTDQALQSTSAENGWVIFDCDLYNTPVSSGVEDVTGFLYSPILDMSELGSVILEWQSVFRYCCFSAAPLTVEVTTDGGSNWTVFPGYGNAIQAFNTISANPLTSQLDLSCVAAGQSEVQVRFGYNSAGAAGYSHYFWGIDDVRIFENPTENDLEVIQVVNGDVLNIWEYRVTPFEQIPTSSDGGLLVGTMFRNNGSADQTDVVITVEVKNTSGDILSTTTSEPFDIPAYGNQGVCPPQLSDTLYLETGWMPSIGGDYVITSTIVSSQTDETPESNFLDKSIAYTPDEYGHDDPEQFDIQLTARDADNPAAGAYDPTGYATSFTCPNEGSEAWGLFVRFGDESDAGAEFEIRLYEGVSDSPFDPNAADIYGWNYFTLAQSWIDYSFNDWVYFPFEESVELQTTDVASGEFRPYFAAIINEFQSDFQLAVQAQSNSDTDNSSLQYERAGSGDFVWFSQRTATPGIRLVFENLIYISVSEENSFHFTLGQNTPNPAQGTTRIPLELQQAHNVTLEIRDMTGKLVQWEAFGTLPPGTHALEVNTSAMSPGTYTYAVIAGTQRMAKQMVVAGQ